MDFDRIVKMSSTESIWQDCFEQWLSSRRTENTRRAYLQAVKDFLVTSGAPLNKVFRSDFVTWSDSMKRRGLRPATISARLLALYSFYQFAVDEFLLIGENPLHLHGLRPRVKAYGSSRALTVAEVKQIISQPNQTKINGLRDFALISGYLILGRRNSEWGRAKIHDFELRDGGIFFRWSGKGKMDELLSVPDELWAVLQNYIQASGGRGMDEFIFLDRAGQHNISDRRIRDIIKRYARLAGIEGEIRVHDLRHTAASLRREAGADVEELRDFLGHASLVTTQVYLHRITRNRDERAGAVCKLIDIKKGKKGVKKNG